MAHWSTHIITEEEEKLSKHLRNLFNEVIIDVALKFSSKTKLQSDKCVKHPNLWNKCSWIVLLVVNVLLVNPNLTNPFIMRWVSQILVVSRADGGQDQCRASWRNNPQYPNVCFYKKGVVIWRKFKLTMWWSNDQSWARGLGKRGGERGYSVGGWGQDYYYTAWHRQGIRLGP